MRRKTILLIALAALVSGLLYTLPTFASAPFQGEQPPAGKQDAQPAHGPRGGVITALGTESLTVQPFAEEAAPLTLSVNEETVYRSKEGLLTFADLSTGDKIAFTARPGEDGSLTALRILRLPADFDPQTFRRHVVRGEVWSVDAAAGTFTIQTRKGNEQLTFFVDGDTIFHSRGDFVQSLDDLSVHTQVAVRGERQEDGTFLAKDVLIARPRLGNHAGTIASVDGEGLTLTLDRRDGQTITFRVVEQTRFKGEAATLEEVQPGMQARVAAFQEGGGGWVALRVGVRTAPPQDTP